MLKSVFFSHLQSGSDDAASSGESNKFLRAIEEAKNTKPTPSEFTFAERDSMLYNLGVGAKRTDLKYVL